MIITTDSLLSTSWTLVYSASSAAAVLQTQFNFSDTSEETEDTCIGLCIRTKHDIFRCCWYKLITHSLLRPPECHHAVRPCLNLSRAGSSWTRSTDRYTLRLHAGVRVTELQSGERMSTIFEPFWHNTVHVADGQNCYINIDFLLHHVKHNMQSMQSKANEGLWATYARPIDVDRRLLTWIHVIKNHARTM